MCKNRQLRFEPGENTDQIVQDVDNSCEVKIFPDEIDRSNRVGKSKENRPKEIIVKFESLDSKVKFLKCRKKLRDRKSDIFINGDLTKARIELFYKCYSMIAASGIEKIFNGNIYIQVKGKNESIKIQSMTDLQRFVL
jgi:hypothetical protein